jgi:putative spermidine/putrescine transport system permease protein
MERGLRYLWALLLALLYGFLLLPLVVVVLASVSGGQVLRFPPEGFSLKWYARFFSDETFISALLLSLRLALVSALVVSILAVTAALFYRRLSARWRGPFRALVLLPLLLPEILTAIGLLFFLYRLGLGSSMFGLQVSHIVVTLPFSFLAVTAALQQVDPQASAPAGSRRFGASCCRCCGPVCSPARYSHSSCPLTCSRCRSCSSRSAAIRCRSRCSIT